jgi:hypothetical protein
MPDAGMGGRCNRNAIPRRPGGRLHGDGEPGGRFMGRDSPRRKGSYPGTFRLAMVLFPPTSIPIGGAMTSTVAQLVDQCLTSWQVHNRIHLDLIEAISDEGLMAIPANSRGRTVAEQFHHIWRVRADWTVYHETGKRADLPRVTKGEPIPRELLVSLLDESGAGVERVLRAAPPLLARDLGAPSGPTPLPMNRWGRPRGVTPPLPPSPARPERCSGWTGRRCRSRRWPSPGGAVQGWARTRRGAPREGSPRPGSSRTGPC